MQGLYGGITEEIGNMRLKKYQLHSKDFDLEDYVNKEFL